MSQNEKRGGILGFLDTTTKVVAAITALITAVVSLTAVLVRSDLLDSGDFPAYEQRGVVQPVSSTTEQPFRPQVESSPAAESSPLQANPYPTPQPTDLYTYPQPQVAFGQYCCDVTWVRRCPLVTPLAVGTSCFCPYQGSGIVCQ